MRQGGGMNAVRAAVSIVERIWSVADRGSKFSEREDSTIELVKFIVAHCVHGVADAGSPAKPPCAHFDPGGGKRLAEALGIDDVAFALIDDSTGLGDGQFNLYSAIPLA